MTEPTNPPEEIKVQEVNQDPPAETVGDIMQKMQGEGLKSIVIVLSAAVYLAGIVYAEVHGITLLQKGVSEDMRMWATLGMIAAGISAVIFPVALKVWAIEAFHRIVAMLFYVADFAFLAFNAFTDFNTQQGQALAPWAQDYVTYILPASPIIIAGMWSILWNLDPDVRDKIQRLTLRMAMKRKMSHQVAEAAKGAQVTARVNAAADREVERALTELFGHPVTQGYVMDATERKRGRLGELAASFFDWASRRALSALSPATPSQSSHSDLDEPNQPPQA